ncbi:DUF418 domain-containing protein [Sabulilitoribacter multivorans]|uniref:DUF418 domain-containing protein n=1 Tax=Flaviramulus multivorans TaxID=1304750 RepID=A0ABS9IKG3_9FLAO|nr:DUF418 domain-containing protein [Flaviramulus multivorans]MCF7561065.1 DUF418 domain-containing protein [Flaviramulus multivorans]
MTNQSDIELRPVERSHRINSLDIIRGIALLGILLMNITGFGLAYAYGDPTNSGGSTGWNLKVWIMDNMFFEGTMRGLFTMLFGAGFILLTTRAESQGGGIKVADLYYRRILWLLLFGIMHAYLLLWYGDILYPYAIFGLMLFPFRNAKPKYLLIAGLVLLSIGSLKDVMTYNEDVTTKTEGLVVEKLKENNKEEELTKEQEKALGKWEELKKSKKTKEEITEANEKNLGGYWSIVKSRFGMNKYMQSAVVYEFWVWDILSFMLIGIAFFKWRIFQGERSNKFYLLLMTIGYVIGLCVNYYETIITINSDFDIIEMSRAGQTYQLGRLFTILGHVGLFMLFIKSGILRFLQNALAAVGKMALTNYLMHTVICITFFLGFGFGMFGKLERYELYYVVLAIWVFQLIYSPIWLKYFKYGPAEWLWRSLSYMQKQPFRNK